MFEVKILIFIIVSSINQNILKCTLTNIKINKGKDKMFCWLVYTNSPQVYYKVFSFVPKGFQLSHHDFLD